MSIFPTDNPVEGLKLRIVLPAQGWFAVSYYTHENRTHPTLTPLACWAVFDDGYGNDWQVIGLVAEERSLNFPDWEHFSHYCHETERHDYLEPEDKSG